MNKMRGGAEKSFLTIATLTSCLTSNPVSAQELWSPISHSLKFNNDPIATKYAALDIESAATPIGSETPVSIDSKPRSKPDLLTSIVEDGAAELGFHNCNVVSQTRQTPNSSQGKS